MRKNIKKIQKNKKYTKPKKNIKLIIKKLKKIQTKKYTLKMEISL